MITSGRAARRLFVVSLLVIAPVVGFSTAASAHSELVSSTPEAGSTLDAAPTQVVLSFDEPVQQQGGTIVVTVGDQVVSQAGTFTADGTSASVQLDSSDVSGTYEVSYRIVSEDGHVGRETFSFEVQGTASTASASGSATPQTPDQTPASDDGGSTGTVVWVLGLGVIGLVLVAALIAVAVRGRRGRSS